MSVTIVRADRELYSLLRGTTSGSAAEEAKSCHPEIFCSCEVSLLRKALPKS